MTSPAMTSQEVTSPEVTWRHIWRHYHCCRCSFVPIVRDGNTYNGNERAAAAAAVVVTVWQEHARPTQCGRYHITPHHTTTRSEMSNWAGLKEQISKDTRTIRLTTKPIDSTQKKLVESWTPEVQRPTMTTGHIWKNLLMFKRVMKVSLLSPMSKVIQYSLD